MNERSKSFIRTQGLGEPGDRFISNLEKGEEKRKKREIDRLKRRKLAG